MLMATALFATFSDSSPVRAAPPLPPPPVSRDTTIPRDAPRSVQRGSQTITFQPISRIRTADGREAVAHRIIVGFKPGVSEVEKATVHRVVGQAQGNVASVPLKPIGRSAQYVDVTGTPSLESAIRAYLADPRVAYAEPDYLVHTTETPNDPSFASQYGMTRINATAAWNLTHGAPTVKIAILDCGIHVAHPDLAGKVVGESDFTSSAYGTDDKCDHGTHVAGIASANTGNGVGVAGVGYTTSLLNGKVLDDSGSGSFSGIIDGIRWATDSGANVISMSLGVIGACSQTLQDGIDYAWQRGVVIVAAAGNKSTSDLFVPAGCAHVVAVASTDASDARSSFSNYGTWVHVAAPGSGIYSTVNPDLNGGVMYGTKSGTSMATPHVAGLAGLLWATRWGTGAQSVVDRLEKMADPIAGTGTSWQYGRINALLAVRSSPPPQLTTLSPSTGSARGGATIIISGSSFQPGVAVTFGGASATVTAVSSTQLSVTLPAHALGGVNVVVTNPDGQRQTMTNAFTYVPDSRAGTAPLPPVAPPATGPPARAPVVPGPASPPSIPPPVSRT